MNLSPNKMLKRFKESVRSNYCHPKGFIGRLMLMRMNRGKSAAMARWGMKHVNIYSHEMMLDIGCGGGANMKRLLKRSTDGFVLGIDISALAIKMSEAYNKKAVRKGMCDVMRANVTSIPFPDETFTLATAFNTVPLWPGPERSFRQVWEVLDQGGRFLIVNYEYRDQDEDVAGLAKLTLDIPNYPASELELYLQKAGFMNIETYHDVRRHFVCLVAHKI